MPDYHPDYREQHLRAIGNYKQHIDDLLSETALFGDGMQTWWSYNDSLISEDAQGDTVWTPELIFDVSQDNSPYWKQRLAVLHLACEISALKRDMLDAWFAHPEVALQSGIAPGWPPPTLVPRHRGILDV
jgi:hypothetical protein